VIARAVEKLNGGLMRKIVIGCAVASLIALSPRSEAKFPDFKLLLPQVVPHRPELSGQASWYGAELQGRPTASGKRFDMNQLTAAHRTLPLGSLVEVTNLRNLRSVILKINDRGPRQNLKDRVIDVSRAAARRLGFMHAGLAPVKIRVLRLPEGYTVPQSSLAYFPQPASGN
jgi:peptidoglycan lytic transglycosylase